MIKLDIQRYIKNRMWFGWWYCYRYVLPHEASSTDGRWHRDRRYHFTPVILVRKTYGLSSKGPRTLDRYYSDE